MRFLFYLAIPFLFLLSACDEKEAPFPSIVIYPNPFTDNVNVDVPPGFVWEVSFLTSENVKVNRVSGKGASKFTVDLSNYEQETIICQIRVDERVELRRLIKAKH